MKMVWAVSAPQYFSPQGSQHLVLGSQVGTLQTSLCCRNPGIYDWTKLDAVRIQKYPKCKHCLKKKQAL